MVFGQTDQGTKISEAEFEKTLKDWKDNNHSVNDLNVKPEDLLHIGDNKHSDYEMPKGFGIDAYFAEKPFDKFLSYWEHRKFERIYYSNYATDEDKVGASIYIGLLVLNWIRNQVSSDKPTDYWNDFGFNIGGVICYSYTKWTAEVAKKNGCSDIFFCRS